MHYSICLDIGNTRVKVGIFDSAAQLVAVQRYTLPFGVAQLEELWATYPTITRTILSSVIHHDEAIETYLQQKSTTYLLLKAGTTPLPFANHYATPHTLGNDRIAAVAGAAYLFPNLDNLVVDAGTCIKYDIVDSKGQYWGGSISPGLQIKSKSLATFTQKLPLIQLTPENVRDLPLTGDTTQNAIASGVLWGSVVEIDGIIDHYRKKYPDLHPILTGGDAIFFENRLKNRIFAAPNLVLIGLYYILNNYHAIYT